LEESLSAIARSPEKLILPDFEGLAAYEGLAVAKGTCAALPSTVKEPYYLGYSACDEHSWNRRRGPSDNDPPGLVSCSQTALLVANRFDLCAKRGGAQIE